MKHLSFLPALAASCVCLLCAAFFGLFFLSCGEEQEAGYAFKTPAASREMLPVLPVPLTIAGAGADGVFVDGRTVSLAPFAIAKYETTWELWKEVCDVARARGYRIANKGTEGGGSAAGGLWTAEQRRLLPVTDITWRDAVVWCNAYSELSGLTPVYYTAEGGILRTSLNNPPENSSRTDTPADLAVQRLDQTGYRLPLETEWEAAGRGGNPAAPAWGFLYSGGNAIDDAAWYDSNAYTVGTGYGIRPAGSKAANTAGLFDMSGNAAEWVWDWYHENGITAQTPPAGDGAGNFAHRVTRGGSWRANAAECAVTARNYCRPFSSGTYLGFRVVKKM